MRFLLILLCVIINLSDQKKIWVGFDPTNPTSAKCIPKEYMETYNYYGRKNTTVDGQECCTWNKCMEVSSYKMYEKNKNEDIRKRIESTADSYNSHNYCRNIKNEDYDAAFNKPKLKDKGPWCYIQTAVGEPCFKTCTETTVIPDTPPPPTEINVDFPDYGEKDDKHERKRKIKSKVGKYIDPMTKFGFWAIFTIIVTLLIMCALFPLIRIYTARRALSTEGSNEKHREDVESYRILCKVFNENCRSPPSFEEFIEKRKTIAAEFDPKNLYEKEQ